MLTDEPDSRTAPGFLGSPWPPQNGHGAATGSGAGIAGPLLAPGDALDGPAHLGPPESFGARAAAGSH